MSLFDQIVLDRSVRIIGLTDANYDIDYYSTEYQTKSLGCDRESYRITDSRLWRQEIIPEGYEKVIWHQRFHTGAVVFYAAIYDVDSVNDAYVDLSAHFSDGILIGPGVMVSKVELREKKGRLEADETLAKIFEKTPKWYNFLSDPLCVVGSKLIKWARKLE